jgi:hypothetical protein
MYTKQFRHTKVHLIISQVLAIILVVSVTLPVIAENSHEAIAHKNNSPKAKKSARKNVHHKKTGISHYMNAIGVHTRVYPRTNFIPYSYFSGSRFPHQELQSSHKQSPVNGGKSLLATVQQTTPEKMEPKGTGKAMTSLPLSSPAKEQDLKSAPQSRQLFGVSPVSLLIFLGMAAFWSTMIFLGLSGHKRKGMRS